MAVLCGMPTIRYSARSAKLSARCLLPAFDAASVTWLNSRPSVAACDWLLSALSAVPSTRVRRRRKSGRFLELYGEYMPGEWLWIDSNGKMETRHPVEDHLVMNFRRSIITAELWRPEVKRRWEKIMFLRFFKNDPLRNNIQNSVPKGFIATPVDVLCSHFVKWLTGNR